MCLKNKIKTSLVAISIVYSVISVAQNKLLTIQDAVLKGRTSLAPKRLQNLSFIPGSTKFSYVDNNTIKIGDNTTGKTSDVISLKELNTQLKSSSKDTLATINLITWKNSSQFYFSNKKGELIYNIDKKIIN